jgi:spoIIIJ-associated protein
MEKDIQKLAQELLDLTGVKVEVEVTEVENNTFEVNVKTEEETGLLIGFRGENILALQTLLGIMVKNKLGEWKRITVNIGDYKEKQDNKLKDLGNMAADRSIETGQPQPIYNLNAAQRRIVHIHLSERGDVTSESEGEEPNRYLVVKVK